MGNRLKIALTGTVAIITALGIIYTANVMSEYQGLAADVSAERQRLAVLSAAKSVAMQNQTMAPQHSAEEVDDWTSEPIKRPSGLDANFLERAFAGTELAGLGECLIAAEADTGISALILAGIIAHESGWGTSRLARDKGNLAGLGAYDGQEYSAGIRFDSRADSIMYLARLLATHYAPRGKHYGGSHDLQGIGVRYASDPGWAAKVEGCMKIIAEAGQ